MPLRPEGKHSSPVTSDFWRFFLEPVEFLEHTGSSGEVTDYADRLRRVAFDMVAGIGEDSALLQQLPASLIESVTAVRRLPVTHSAQRLFKRLADLEPGRREVLLKAAAEWIFARYWRARENWDRRHEEWAKERADWEKRHPELTDEIRREFNNIFHELKITHKRPRICSWERLKRWKDDCDYAGERISIGAERQSHAPLCAKYKEFHKRQGKNFKKYFVENAGYYIKLRRKHILDDRTHVMRRFLKEHPEARWFPDAWKSYLNALGVEENTLVAGGPSLPHCVEFAGDRKCAFNKHTELCMKYRAILEKRGDLQPFEALYREWRAEYLSGPSKPSFRYPSSRALPVPKIFGSGYFRADFDESTVGLRLEGMPEGHFMRFGFAPWPAKYDPQPQDANITSVHVNFVGVRARIGFRFEVEHAPSRFGVAQDDIDDLRSRKYPRRAQDGQFLDEARQALLNSFTGDAEREMRLLSVDLGQTGAAAALYVGRSFRKAHPLKIVKTKKLSEAQPAKKKGAQPKKKRAGKKESEEPPKRKKHKGLNRRHVGDHLRTWSEGAREIAAARAEDADARLHDHDMRSLSLHVRWMIRDWVRLNASQIVKAAEREKADLIVFESLRGFRAPGYDSLKEEKKRFLAYFAHGRIRRKVTEKAVERGMRVVTVPYFKSSQFCAVCKREQEDKNRWYDNKRRREFVCEYCGYKSDDSDVNAARVLARVFWGEIVLPEKA